MEHAKGFVKSVGDGVITVVVDQAPVCTRCAAGKGCGAGLMAGTSNPAELELSLPAGKRFRRGDTVQLSVAPQWLLRAALIAYGVPLLGTVIAASIAWLSGIAASDLKAASVVLLGLVGGVLLSRRLLARTGLCRRFEPHLEGSPGASTA